MKTKAILELIYANLLALKANERLHIRGQFYAEQLRPNELTYHYAAAKATIAAVKSEVDLSQVHIVKNNHVELSSAQVLITYGGTILRGCSSKEAAEESIADATGQGHRVRQADGSPIYDYDLALSLVKAELDFFMSTRNKHNFLDFYLGL